VGGWGHIFGAADAKFAGTPSPADDGLLASSAQLGYSTLALDRPSRCSSTRTP
jgi:SSS family solute:Na+ symporter